MENKHKQAIGKHEQMAWLYRVGRVQCNFSVVAAHRKATVEHIIQKKNGHK